MLHTTNASLYDSDGWIIFKALRWILSMSFEKYSGMLKCQIWLQYSNIGLIHVLYTAINVFLSALALFKRCNM